MPDDPRRGPRRYGPNADNGGRQPNPPYRQPEPSGPLDRPMPPTPSSRDRQAAARAWSELDGADPQPTRMLPTTGPAQGAVPGQPPVPGPRMPVPPRAGGPQQPPPPGARRPAALIPPPPAHHTHGGVIAGRIIATALAVAVLVATGFYWTTRSDLQDVANSNGVSNAGTKGVVFSGGMNLLLVGSDARTDQDGNPLSAQELADVSTTDDGGGVNTDTIIVVHIPEGGAKATAVSIPRDTWIPQSVTDTVTGPYEDGSEGTYKPNKINSFYGAAKFYKEGALAKQGVPAGPNRTKQSDEAGRTMLIKIVQAFTGLKIDHYAEVNLIGFYTLSNAIGGVPVCLNAAVNDPFSGAKFPKGEQEISGKAAMSFVRQRHGLPNGDLDRVRRQQAFLAGAARKMLSANVLANPSRLSGLVQAANRSLVLDKGFDLLDFASQMTALTGGNLSFTTIPTHGDAQASGTDALATDPAEIHSFFAKLAGGSAKTSSSAPATSVDRAKVTVDVLDATSQHQSGTPIWDKLAAAGFQRGQNTDATAGGSLPTTVISYPKGGQAAAAQVQSVLGGVGKLEQSDKVDAGHVRVMVGEDLAGSGLRAPMSALLAAPTTGPTASSSAGDSLTANGIQCVN